MGLLLFFSRLPATPREVMGCAWIRRSGDSHARRGISRPSSDPGLRMEVHGETCQGGGGPDDCHVVLPDRIGFASDHACTLRRRSLRIDRRHPDRRDGRGGPQGRRDRHQHVHRPVAPGDDRRRRLLLDSEPAGRDLRPVGQRRRLQALHAERRHRLDQRRHPRRRHHPGGRA